MLHDALARSGRLTLKQALVVLGQSKATFYRHYRPAPVAGALTLEESEQVWDYFTRRLDIREVLIAGRPTLTLDRAAVLALIEENRARATGPLAVDRSARAARFGKCAEKGYGSRVMKDGRPRSGRGRLNDVLIPVHCQR